MKKASKTYKRTGDEENKTELDAICARFQDFKGGFKSLHRMKYDLCIEELKGGIKSEPQKKFKFANIKRNSSGYSSSMLFESQSARGPEEVVNWFVNFFYVFTLVRLSPFCCPRSTLCRMKSMSYLYTVILFSIQLQMLLHSTSTGLPLMDIH
jgi:hypothetical protein